MSDNVKIVLRVVVAAVGVTVLALVSSPGGDTERIEPAPLDLSRDFVRCDDTTMVGTGSDDWRADSIPAGPLGIRRRPLRSMQMEPDGSLTTKMPVLVEGHGKVKLFTPPGQEERISLYYGDEANSFADDQGFDSITFIPCEDQDRTVWPGGIRVIGERAVRLRVRTEDEDSFAISLGRPREVSTPNP